MGHPPGTTPDANQIVPRERPPLTRLGRPRSPAVDRAILRAAIKLFIERGFDGVTMEQVAETAGVARTTLYRRWSSAEALIAQAIAVERGEPERAVPASRVSSSDLVNQLLDAVSRSLASPDYLRMAARLIGTVPDHPELMSIYWENYLLPRRNAVRSLIERFRADGLIPIDANADILLDLMSGAVLHYVLVRPGRRSAADIRTYLHNVIHELGLKDEPDEPNRNNAHPSAVSKRKQRHG
jgi:AcrR family transcriptional regulator